MILTPEIHQWLETLGWSVDCQSPLEMSHVDGSFASMQAASYLLAALMQERKLESRSPDAFSAFSLDPCENVLHAEYLLNNIKVRLEGLSDPKEKRRALQELELMLNAQDLESESLTG